MDEKLKPCPFCGGEAELRGFDAPEYWVWCPNCKASTDAHTCKGGAIEAWNTRVETVTVTGTMTVTDFLWVFHPHYCPNCGCKVVNE